MTEIERCGDPAGAEMDVNVRRNYSRQTPIDKEGTMSKIHGHLNGQTKTDDPKTSS